MMSRVEGYLFVNKKFAQVLVARLGFKKAEDFKPRQVGGFDGGPSHT